MCIYIYMCVCVFLYLSIYTHASIGLSIYLSIYLYICIYNYIYVYIYVSVPFRLQDARSKHPKPAAVLLKSLLVARAASDSSALRAGGTAQPLQILGASATVGRPLRREVQTLLGRSMVVSQLSSADAAQAAGMLPIYIYIYNQCRKLVLQKRVVFIYICISYE